MRVASLVVVAIELTLTSEFIIDDCEKIVSVDERKSHLRCQNECVTLVQEGWEDPFADGVFNASCVTQHFTVDKEIIIPDSRCFSSLVFGSMMKSINETVFVKATLTRTPAGCMKTCQMRTDCHHWYFIVPSHSKGEEGLSTCVLESTEQILEDILPPTVSRLCNLDFLERPYDRQSCGPSSQTAPCAAITLEAVSGWRDCARKDICHSDLPHDLQKEKAGFREGCCQETSRVTTTTKSIESSFGRWTTDAESTSSEHASIHLPSCAGEECEKLDSCEEDGCEEPEAECDDEVCDEGDDEVCDEGDDEVCYDDECDEGCDEEV